MNANSDNILEIDRIEVLYDNVIAALHDVSLNVPRGKIVALLGGNGAGKSTTLKAISTMLAAERGVVTKGSITYDGIPVRGQNPAEMVGLGMVQVLEGRRCFGAGIVSSPSEAKAAMTGTACEFRPFDLMTVLRTPYRIDIVQPIYYVIDGFADLEAIVDQDIGAMIDKAKLLGDFAPAFEAKAS